MRREEAALPRPYSADLRERVLLACERREGTREAVARRFRVAASPVHDWLRAARAEGRPARAQAARPRVSPAGRPRDGAGRAGGGAERRHPGRVRRAARRARRRAAQPRGPVPGARGARLGPEGKALRAAEQGREDLAAARAAWRAELAGLDPRRLVFLDEGGIDTRMTRGWARAPRGRRATGTVPHGRWERLTVIGALALDGVVAAMSVAAATSAAVFPAFAEQVLAPALRDRPGAVVVMDNLAAHKAEAVRGALDRAGGLAHRHLPPHSPDLNPIEPCWPKLKARPRAEAARPREALEAALGPALAAITARDARGWFRLAGYPAPE